MLDLEPEKEMVEIQHSFQSITFGMDNIRLILRRNVMRLYSEKPCLDQRYTYEVAGYDVIT
jgi:hypothetical protein